MEAITVSEGRPIASARDLITDVLPVPGDPQSSTGTRTDTASARASTTAA